MKPTFTSVPFKGDDNFTQFAGVGKFSAAGIVLEYEKKLFGIIKNGITESRISLDDILDLKFKRGFFKRGAKIEIRLKSFARLSEVPHRNGTIILKLEHRDFERGEEAVKRVHQSMEESLKLETSQVTVSDLFEEETKDLSEK